MPTPRPMSVASVGENVAMSITCARRPVSARPQPSASTAVNSGSSVAPSEPKAIASTTAAGGGKQRHHRRPQRAVGNREHEGGGEEADELARTAALLLSRLLDAAAAQ